MKSTKGLDNTKSSRVESLSDWFDNYGGRPRQLGTGLNSSDSHQNAALLQKFNEQRILANRMNETLEALNEDSRLTKKNLHAAIAVSKQPGYFEYHSPSTDIVDKSKTLHSYSKSIKKIGNEIEQIEKEMSQNKSHNDLTLPDIQLNSLSQWFSAYGRPHHEDIDGMVTSFQTIPKVYGGTAHHRPFKSQASSMKKGRITRFLNVSDLSRKQLLPSFKTFCQWWSSFAPHPQ
eukprot:gene9578-19904_t